MLVKLYKASTWAIGTLYNQFFSSNSYAESVGEASPVNHLCFVDSNNMTNYVTSNWDISDIQKKLVANCKITHVTNAYEVDPDRLDGEYGYPHALAEPAEERASCPSSLTIWENSDDPKELFVEQYGQGFFGGSTVDWGHYILFNRTSWDYQIVRDPCIDSTLAESAPVGKWGTSADKYATGGGAGILLLLGLGYLFFKRHQENRQQQDELLHDDVYDLNG